jgi:hypothetical protein
LLDTIKLTDEYKVDNIEVAVRNVLVRMKK